MRVTNGMIRNNMILGLNKNMNKLGSLYEQMNTLKKIQRPSDDPIVLGRSLKLRLNVLETEQYQTNINEAKSWMEVSDNAVDNSHEILNSIRELSVQASNDTLDTKDRDKILTSIKQLRKQFTQEANASYAGRNVFAGYKTDQKVLYDKEEEFQPAIEFRQKFTKANVEEVGYREEPYYRIRLPYGDISTSGFSGSTDFNIISANSTHNLGKDASVYHPQGNDVYFLQDTGEFIFSKEGLDILENKELEISYSKTNFKEGDPNPEIFFDKNAAGEFTKTKKRQSLEYEIGIGTKLDINVIGTDLYNPQLLRDIDEIIDIVGKYDLVEEQINSEDLEGGQVNRDFRETISLSQLFTRAIGKADEGLKRISGQQADLGSRMKRLEFTQKRLGDDEVNFTELLSRTEDVDLERVYVDFNTQYAVYQSALQATSKVVQPTLMDFLR